MRLDRLRVAALREDLQQVRVADEIEAGERGALLVEVAGERLLADLELLEQVRQQVVQVVVAVAVLHDVARLERLDHHLLPRLVDRLEALRLLRQLLGDVARGEDGLEVLPHGLHGRPLLENLGDGGELLDPLIGQLLEGDNEARRKHRAKAHLRLLENFHHLRSRAHVEHDVAALLEGAEGEHAHDPVARCR